MMQVTLYSRSDCHLCEQARQDLDALQNQIPHRLVVVDVDSTLELKRRFGFEVPVVEVGPYVLKAPFTRQTLQMTLGAARDRLRQIDGVENSNALDSARGSVVWTRADGFTYWMSRHFMLVINLIFAAYLGFSILAPALMQVGATGPAQVLYRGYSLVCHQLAYRSFFLFGEQGSYPRQAAGVDRLVSYGQATGQSEGTAMKNALPPAIISARRASAIRLPSASGMSPSMLPSCCMEFYSPIQRNIGRCCPGIFGS